MPENRTGRVWILALACAAAFGSAAVAVAETIEGVPRNGLSSEAFRLNALTTNKEALGILVQNGLKDVVQLNHGYIGHQLRDPNARAVMKDLVACALGTSPPISYTDELGETWQWQGQLGLCEGWYAGAPSVACQELVTACLAARVNALNESIPIALRGESPLLPSVASPVRTGARFRESPAWQDPSEGVPIESFAGPMCGPGHACDWQFAYVGTCDPGSWVELAINDAAACGTARLRVCDGIHGCPPAGHPLPPGLQPPPPPEPRYWKFRTQQSGACEGSPLKFRCPAEPGVAGYFSTMVLPEPAGSSPALHGAVVKVSGTGVFPAKLTDAFTFIEGAYYGNLFRPDRLARSCEVTSDGAALTCVPGPAAREDAGRAICRRPLGRGTGEPGTVVPRALADEPAAGRRDAVPASQRPRGRRARTGVDDCLVKQPSLPYEDVYACFSYAQRSEQLADDQTAAATLNARICDLPGAGAHCFPHKLARCHYGNGDPRGVCDARGADGAFGQCRGDLGDPTVYHQIITTYLNEPCDVIGAGGELCASLRASLPPTGVGPVGGAVVGRGARGCGGCATGRADGALPLAVIAALVAFGIRRRRR